MAAAFAAALYFTLLLPLQTYLACAAGAEFTAGELVAEFSVYFALAWLCLSAILFALSYVPLAKAVVDSKGRKRRKISLQFHVLALSLVVAAIVESGPLSIGLPELDGDFAGYRLASRAVVDLIVLVILIITPLLCYRWLKRHVAWIALGVALYSALSLFDVKRAKAITDQEDKMIVHDLVPRYDVAEGAYFSASNNILVLILDTISTHAMAEILRNDAELAAHFPGFVNYVDNLGMHWKTAVAIPGIMTGKYYENSGMLREYGLSPYGEHSFIKDFIDRGLPVFLNVAISPKGWSNALASNGAGGGRGRAKPSKVPIEGTLSLTTPQMSLFRIAPYCLKETCAMSAAAPAAADEASGDSADSETKPRANIANDDVLWPLLSSRPVRTDQPLTLHIHHSLGGHAPFNRDENGRKVSVKNPQFKDYTAHCKYAVRKLAAFLDSLRAKGVYDASTIIVLSDHGVDDVWPETEPMLRGVDTLAFPFLMVKPRGAGAPLRESNLPTSSSKIAKLVTTLREHNLDQDAIDAILRTDERLCRTIVSENITDWIVDCDWNVTKKTTKDVDKSIDNLRPVVFDQLYTLNINNNALPYPDFAVHPGHRSFYMGLCMKSLTWPMSFGFRMPKGKKKCDVMFKMRFHQKPVAAPCKVVAKCGECVVSLSNIVNGSMDNYFILKDCRPDEDGIVIVEFYHIGAVKKQLWISFLEFLVSDEIATNPFANDFAKESFDRALAVLDSWRIDFMYDKVDSESASVEAFGDDVLIEYPQWMNKGKKKGVSVTGHSLGDHTLTLKCHGDGVLAAALRDVDIVGPEGRAALFADYQSFKINGTEILSGLVMGCQDKPSWKKYEVKDGDELKIEFRTVSHKYRFLDLRKALLDASGKTRLTEDTVDSFLTVPQLGKYLKVFR